MKKRNLCWTSPHYTSCKCSTSGCRCPLTTSCTKDLLSRLQIHCGSRAPEKWRYCWEEATATCERKNLLQSLNTMPIAVLSFLRSYEDWDPVPEELLCWFAGSAVAVQSFCRSRAQIQGAVNCPALTLLIWSKSPAGAMQLPQHILVCRCLHAVPHSAVLILHTAPMLAQAPATKQWLMRGGLCCK